MDTGRTDLAILMIVFTMYFIRDPYTLVLFFHDDRKNFPVYIFMGFSIAAAYIISNYCGIYIVVLLLLLLSQKYFKFIIDLKIYTFIIRLLLISNLVNFLIKW